jgi:membrane protease subunit HflK
LQAILSKFRGSVFLYALAFLLLVVGIKSAIYTVPADSEGIVMRFGSFARVTEPGLRFKVPFGVDRVEVVPVRRVQKMEFGFGTGGASNIYQFVDYDEQALERSMITGDKNAATVEWVVQYKIDKPQDYLFQVRNPELTLRDASESVMREMVGDRTVDEVLTVGRKEIEDKALQKLQDLVNLYGLGFRIDQVQLKNVNPPQPVQASFNEVNQAQQEMQQSINIARGEYNKAVPRAKGEADRQIAEAEGAATKRVNEAQGDANRFMALFKEYQLAPEVTRQRLYLEKMTEVLPILENKVIVDENATGVLPLLHLGDQNRTNLGK